MESHARTVVEHGGVIKAAMIGKERDIEIDCRGQLVWQIAPCVHVEEPYFGLVFSAEPDHVRHDLPVFGDIRDGGVGGMIRAHGIGIDQHHVLARFSLPHVDHRLLLVRRAFAEK